jgi:hypothetical protein
MDLSKLDSVYSSQRGFVLGGGSSIHVLEDAGFDFRVLNTEVAIAVNQSFKLCNPKVITSTAKDFLQRNKGAWGPDVHEQFCDTLILLPPWIPPVDDEEEDIRIVRLNAEQTYYHDLPYSFTEMIPSREDSGCFGVVLAYLLGCNPIYLLGFDGVLIDKASHFHNDYKWSLSKIHVTIFRDNFLRIYNMLKGRDVDIFSCSEVSLLNSIIPYKDIFELF